MQQLPQGLDKQLVKYAGKSGKVATVWTEQITCAKTKQRQLARNEADEISQTNQGEKFTFSYSSPKKGDVQLHKQAQSFHYQKVSL